MSTQTGSALKNPEIYISVQGQDFDLAEEYSNLRQQATNPGAIAMFSGLVREIHASAPAEAQSLTLEHYPGMTESALRNIAVEASGRWPVTACRVIHRTGTLLPGDQIVLVGCASAHRADALAATEFIMDYLKTSAPFWKKQIAGADSHWVASRTSDYEAAARWKNREGSE